MSLLGPEKLALLFLQAALAFLLLLADALLFLLADTFLFLLADTFLLLAKLFFTLAAHLLGIVDAVEVRFVGFVGFGHGFGG